MSNPIEFGIGGNNTGFATVLNDTLKKAKATSAEITATFDKIKFGDPNGSSGGMSKQFDKEKAKITAGVKDIASEFSKATGISSAFGDTLGKIGSAVKSGGGIMAAVTALAAFGKAAYDAHQAAGALDLAIEKIGKRNRPGVANVSMGDIEENLSDIRERRKNIFDQDRHKGEAFQGTKDWLDAAKIGVSDTLETGRIGSGATAKRDAQLRQEEMASLERLGKKQKEITSIVRERVTGSKEEADVMALQAEYAEKIDKARDKGNGAAGQVQSLTEERDLKEAEIRRAAESARITRSGSFAESYIVGRDAGKTDNVQLAQAKLSTAKGLVANAGTDEEKKTAETVVAAAEAALKVAEHEEEVRSRTSQTDMQIANLRGSAADRQENALRKQVELSQTLFSLAKSRIEKEERGVALAREQRALEEFLKTRTISETDTDAGSASSRISAIGSRLWRGRSSQEEQRGKMTGNISAALAAKTAADQNLQLDPTDVGLQAKAKAAADALTKATEEKAKWERDIARSNEAAAKSVKVQNDAQEFIFRGLPAAAEYTQRRATNEAAIVQAMRDGNIELAKQLQAQGNLDAKAQVRARFVTPGGNVKSEYQVRREMRIERQRAERVNRRMEHLEENNYISGVERDTSRRIKGGTNMLTGLPAETEMQHRANASRAQAEIQDAKIKAVAAGTASPDQAMSRIAQLMEAWNNG